MTQQPNAAVDNETTEKSALPAPGTLGPKQADWCRENIPFFADMESANKASKEPVKPK